MYASCHTSKIESEANFCGKSRRALRKICRGDELVMYIGLQAETPSGNSNSFVGLNFVNHNVVKLNNEKNKSKWQTKSKELCQKWSLEYGGEPNIPFSVSLIILYF